ncbi:MAG: hypothetical protein CL607_14300 [Anaerolineaceae bacterium]|nr:hypothetical protein [Anaerolineaceae bacterium]
MKDEEKELKNEETVVESAEEPKKKRSIKAIFKPLSIAFYAGIAYLVYRRIRNKTENKEPEPILTTA